MEKAEGMWGMMFASRLVPRELPSLRSSSFVLALVSNHEICNPTFAFMALNDPDHTSLGEIPGFAQGNVHTGS